MKFLITSAFVALRSGQYVKADESAQEFILDTENCDLAVSTLLEIAAANNIEAKKGKKDKVVETLEAGLLELEIPEMNSKPESDIVKEIVQNGVDNELSDDEMLIAIVLAKIPFKKAGKLFNQAMIDGGFLISAKDRKAEIKEILVAAEFHPEEYSEVSSMLLRITEGVKADEENDVEELKAIADTTTSQAMKSIREFAKEFEFVLPKPEKAVKGGFKAIVQNAVVKNPAMTKAEFLELCDSKKKDQERCLKTIWPTIVWAQNVVKSAQKED
jgi:hypothetical protein